MAEIAGGKMRRVQVRMPRKDGWTKAHRAVFLKVLGETCNVMAAARAAGKTDGSARQLRQRDGEFSMLWSEALEIGYTRLEDELLARALGQVSSGQNPAPDEIDAAPVPVAEFDSALAIRVLQLRRDPGGTGRANASRRMSQGEVDEALLKRLDALAARHHSAAKS